MNDRNTQLAASRVKSPKPSSYGLEERTDASRSVVTGSAQHGSRVADPAQSPASERQSDDSTSGKLERIRDARSASQIVAGEPCEEERLASMGQETSERREPLHPKSTEDMVKPEGTVSTDNVLRLLEYQQYRCALTGRELTPDTAALDHIIPIRCNGEHVIENTQVLHKEVNRSKGSLTNEEFKQMCVEIVEHMKRQNQEETEQ